MVSENSINSLKWKNGCYLIIYWKIIFFYQFFENFLALLSRKMNLLEIFDMGDFLKIFYISRNNKILIKWNF